jgi:hypothetical protein
MALLPLSVLALRIAAACPDMVESVYSRAAYPAILCGLALLTGWFPFSVAEILVVAALACAVFLVLRAAVRLFGGRRSVGNVFLQGVTLTVAVAGVLAAAGLLLWGFNYQRVPLARSADLDTSPASVAELRALCEDLLAGVNALRREVREDGRGVMCVTDSRAEALQRAARGVEGLLEDRGYPGCAPLAAPKRVFLSPVLASLGISGFYFPFTGEANLHGDLPAYQFLFAACHETAHMSGFAPEDEANFIAALACAARGDVDFRYAGALSSLGYALRALAKADRDSGARLVAAYSEGVRRDLRQAAAFWRRYESPVAAVSSRVNDVYLKSQGQADGVRSYGRIVDLLIAERRKGAGGRRPADGTGKDGR